MSDQPTPEPSLPCPVCGQTHPTLVEFIECVKTHGTKKQQAIATIGLLEILQNVEHDPTHDEDCSKCELVICPNNPNYLFGTSAQKAKLN